MPVQSYFRVLPVFENSRLAGIVPWYSFIDPPKKRVLVDHIEVERRADMSLTRR